MNIMKINNKKLAVTGGCGFIGSHIVEALAKAGNEVIVIDNLASGTADNLSGFDGNVKVHNVSIIDDLKPYLEGTELIFHLAANISVIKSIEDPEYNNKINVEGTLNVLETARKLDVKKVINSSSCAVYGETKTIPNIESSELKPISPYGESKSVAEEHCKDYSGKYGLDTVSLRYFNVYGPRQAADSPYSGVIVLFIKKALSGEPITIYGDGEQSRDFIAVSDIVRANIAAAGIKSSGEAFNIGTGGATTVNQLTDQIESFTSNLKKEYAPAREGEIKHSYADTSLAEKELGFKTQLTLEQGLKDLIEEFKKN